MILNLIYHFLVDTFEYWGRGFTSLVNLDSFLCIGNQPVFLQLLKKNYCFGCHCYLVGMITTIWQAPKHNSPVQRGKMRIVPWERK